MGGRMITREGMSVREIRLKRAGKQKCSKLSPRLQNCAAFRKADAPSVA